MKLKTQALPVARQNHDSVADEISAMVHRPTPVLGQSLAKIDRSNDAQNRSSRRRINGRSESVVSKVGRCLGKLEQRVSAAMERRYRRLLPGVLLRRVMADARGLAETTEIPLLVFPMLAEESAARAAAVLALV